MVKFNLKLLQMPMMIRICLLRRFFAVIIVFLLSVITVFAGSKLNDLNIHVVLDNNGDARITETRLMHITAEGTECYIVLQNLKGQTISDLEVSDESGTTFNNIGEWDVSRSRAAKTGQCGIVTKSDGYEICWGLGEKGERTYITSYTVHGLMKSYEDSDGFNWMFVAEGVKPRPQHVKLIIEAAEGDSLITPDNTRIWGFRYRGDIVFEGDSIHGYKIVAESSEPFTQGSAMVAMVEFDKGLFSPKLSEVRSFEDVKGTAFEGSDYRVADEGFSFKDWLLIIFGCIIVLSVPIVLIWKLIQFLRMRRKTRKNLLWYRDIPFEGNLQEANKDINAFRWVSPNNDNMLSACVLKLIQMGALHIGMGLDKKGRTVQRFEIKEFPNADTQPELLRKIFHIFKLAAGNDSVLEPKELKKYMKAKENRPEMDNFVDALHECYKLSYYKDKIEEVRKLNGLKKFLKEFTLLDERGAQEVGLWKDYMVYATLFGIADQVIRDMKKINPEYFLMDDLAKEMADDMTLPVIYSTFRRSTNRAIDNKAAREARDSGGGGSASWGGGGGFSGGGFGGGVR